MAIITKATTSEQSGRISHVSSDKMMLLRRKIMQKRINSFLHFLRFFKIVR